MRSRERKGEHNRPANPLRSRRLIRRRDKHLAPGLQNRLSTRAARISTDTTAHDHKEVTMKTQITKQHINVVGVQPQIAHNQDREKKQSLTTLAIFFAILVTTTLYATQGMAQNTSLRFASTSGQLSTTGGSWSEITGLVFNIPAAPLGGPATTARVTLNVPAPYATGTNTPGGCFGITVNYSVQTTIACFTYDSTAPQSYGRKPTTLVVAVPLQNYNSQRIAAVWYSVRNSTVMMDTASTLSAVIAPLP